MIVSQQLLQGADADLSVDQHGYPVADREQRVEIMSDHEYGETEAAPQIANQGVEIAGRDRVEPGRGLIEKDDLRIEC